MIPRTMTGKIAAGVGIPAAAIVAGSGIAALFGSSTGAAIAGWTAGIIGPLELILGFPFLAAKITEWMRTGKIDFGFSGGGKSGGGGGGHGGGH